ncbi:MAG: hypothetical protein ACRDV3_00335 [Acidothermaceae bacterium]
MGFHGGHESEEYLSHLRIAARMAVAQPTSDERDLPGGDIIASSGEELAIPTTWVVSTG